MVKNAITNEIWSNMRDMQLQLLITNSYGCESNFHSLIHSNPRREKKHP